MLWFERQVVDTLTRDVDEPARAGVIAYVETALHSMPEYLRAGVAAESTLFGALARARAGFGPLDDAAVHDLLHRLEHSPIDAVRQYPRLLTSLVLLAQQELAPEPEPAAR